MHTLIIRGGRPLTGEISVSGSKNAILPMLAATVLFREPCVLKNCPELTDVDAALEILGFLGARWERRGGTIAVDPRPVCRWEIPGALMGKMRGSVFFAGPLLARFGRCRLATPGGCPLGKRPVDFHARGFEALGAVYVPDDPELFRGNLRGTEITLPYPSVGATENLLLAALGAEGTTCIRNAAREPEINALCDFLRSGGCRITGDGTGEIRITGGLPRQGEATVIPDRMEAATFACAVASAGGRIVLSGAEHRHLTAVLDVLQTMGCGTERKKEILTVEAHGLAGGGLITTGPYPGFPTDAQAPLGAAALKAAGETIIRETVFDSRVGHLPGLRAMGGQIEETEHTARIRGVNTLHGAAVRATDLRGGAALAVAALGARGESRITGVHHILRGYAHFTEKLRLLGADIRLT